MPLNFFFPPRGPLMEVYDSIPPHFFPPPSFVGNNSGSLSPSQPLTQCVFFPFTSLNRTEPPVEGAKTPALCFPSLFSPGSFSPILLSPPDTANLYEKALMGSGGLVSLLFHFYLSGQQFVGAIPPRPGFAVVQKTSFSS